MHGPIKERVVTDLEQVETWVDKYSAIRVWRSRASERVGKGDCMHSWNKCKKLGKCGEGIDDPARMGWWVSWLIAYYAVITIFLNVLQLLWASLVAQLVKNPPVNEGDVRDAGFIPGSRSSPREGNSNQYSHLENSVDPRTWQATAHWATKCQTLLNTHTHTYAHTHTTILPFNIFAGILERVDYKNRKCQEIRALSHIEQISRSIKAGFTDQSHKYIYSPDKSQSFFFKKNHLFYKKHHFSFKQISRNTTKWSLQ